MEPEESTQPKLIPVPDDIQPMEAEPVVPTSSPLSPAMKKRASLKDLLVSLLVIIIAGGTGWFLANRNSGASETDTSTPAATESPVATPTALPTPDFTSIDATLKTLDADLSTVDTSISAAASAPADTDTTP